MRKSKSKPRELTTDGLDKKTSSLILSADLANIVKKVKAGKPLSQTEREIIRKSTTAASPNIVYDSIAQAAAAMGVPKSVLRKLKRDGAPGFHGSRVYTGELQPHLEEKHRASAGKSNELEDRETLECRRLLAQCKRIEHAFAVDARSVIPLEPVRSAISAIGEQLKSVLRSIYEDEMPPILSGLSPEAIRVETRKANDRLCDMLHTGTLKLIAPRPRP